ncbi:MAG TPA: nucleoside-diphosphate sugar epimerase/dehydratase [Bryobacteraceae bacterium]|nr:nucleoside-diphosphate sugar epimerase/dehydratase [Bryobacteraceae bacterium]
MTSAFKTYVRKALNFHLPVAFAACIYAAYLLRFDFRIPEAENQYLVPGLFLAIVVKWIVFYLARLNRFLWKFVSIADLVRLFFANAAASLAFAIVARVVLGPGFPRSVYVIDFLLCFLATCSVRFVVRLYLEARVSARSSSGRKRILIYGAGAAGITLVRDIRANPSYQYEVVGFLDDEIRKRGLVLQNVKVLGRGRDASLIVDSCSKKRSKIDEIVIAMPSASGRQMREALANCRASGVRCRTIPGTGELLAGKMLTSQIRDVSVLDLLGREPVHIEESRIRDSLTGQVVMVTGAAGSIGSELSRQVASFGPRRLILFDQAESDLFRIDAELRDRYPKLDILAALGDIRDEARVRDVICVNSVDAIYHAAAYKHVPIMEQYPLEAVRNNVLGTHNLATIAREYGVSSFLMISSDKAVNPSSVMGATKRLDELILSGFPKDRTKFVSVRFGNVLGSNGSVIPTFQKQIQGGGPVTVTHPDMRRYFMTIREAVQLVLLASTMGAGSEVFVLDMGEPVKIVDLANQMIRLAGLVPGRDIEIQYTGLRPGEKLYEELVLAGEAIVPTSHQKISILKGQSVDPNAVAGWISRLDDLVERRDVTGTLRYLSRLVPEYVVDARWKLDEIPETATVRTDRSGRNSARPAVAS